MKTDPICGMALEPKSIVGELEEESAAAKDLTRRFWIGALLSVPVLLLAMAHMIPGFYPSRSQGLMDELSYVCL